MKREEERSAKCHTKEKEHTSVLNSSRDFLMFYIISTAFYSFYLQFPHVFALTIFVSEHHIVDDFIFIRVNKR